MRGSPIHISVSIKGSPLLSSRYSFQFLINVCVCICICFHFSLVTVIEVMDNFIEKKLNVFAQRFSLLYIHLN